QPPRGSRFTAVGGIAVMTSVQEPRIGTSNRSNVGAELQHEIEQFLYDESDLLDRRCYEEWLTILAPDIHYWMPTRTNRLQRQQSKEVGSEKSAAYFDETFEHLEQRVRRL